MLGRQWLEVEDFQVVAHFAYARAKKAMRVLNLAHLCEICARFAKICDINRRPMPNAPRRNLETSGGQAFA